MSSRISFLAHAHERLPVGGAEDVADHAHVDAVAVGHGRARRSAPQQLFFPQRARAGRVVNIVVDVGDAVGELATAAPSGWQGCLGR